METGRYQKNIKSVFQNTTYNINVAAVAGSGKTTLLLDLLKLIPRDKSSAFFAFNNFIVEELKERNTQVDVTITTLHAYGWRSILNRYGSKIKMNKNKVIAKTEKVLKKTDNVTEKQRGFCYYVIPKIVDLMRSNLINNDVESISDMCDHYDLAVTDFEIDIANKVFDLVVKDKSQFDFADMIYQPIVDPTIRCFKFDYVFCDESQDFSLAQQSIIKKAINRNGRLITVGDPRQAIYGFAGADANSYGNLSGINGKAISMPLSVSYRCARRIIEEAKEIVPQIQAHVNAIEGKVYEGSLTEIVDGNWIICRNLKPLVETYLWLLKNKVKSKIRGIDIGKGLISFIEKTGAKTIPALLRSMGLEREKLFNKLKAKGVKTPTTHPKMETLENTVEVLEYLCDEVDNVIGLKRLIENIFSDSKEGIILSTIHKSKGLETNKVFFLIPELIPSKYAIQDWQLEQEQNLKYVCITRAKETLVYVNRSQFTMDIKNSINIENNGGF